MTKKITLKVRGIHCQSCVSLIKNNVNSLPGIVNVIVDIDSKKAEVIYDGKKTNESDVIEKIKKAGDYTVEQWDKAEESQGDSPVEVVAASSPRQNDGDVGPGILSGKRFLTVLFVISVFLNIIFLSNSASRDVLKNSFASLSQSGNTAQNKQEQVLKKNAKAPLVADQVPQAGKQVSFTITKDNHIRGDFDASITLIEFSDFECPFCERHYRTLQQLFSKYPQEIRLIYKHFPLGFHQNV